MSSNSLPFTVILTITKNGDPPAQILAGNRKALRSSGGLLYALYDLPQPILSLQDVAIQTVGERQLTCVIGVKPVTSTGGGATVVKSLDWVTTVPSALVYVTVSVKVQITRSCGREDDQGAEAGRICGIRAYWSIGGVRGRPYDNWPAQRDYG